ncbi:MAG: hypothetical protein H6627_10250 [Calditrichae bacterium]|nr:hypothetical protein [Calditrichota bacterium]MCB9058937.1 hypothetical protein [Calditrichia bacterium]
MIKIILLAIFCSNILFGQDAGLNQSHDVSWSFAYVNDNYSATWLNGKSENYIGADDFLTTSFLLRLYKDDRKLSVTYNTITSRYFNYRFDLITAGLAQNFKQGFLDFQPQIGIIYKGDLAGETIQNTWHRMRAIQKVHLPYSRDKGIALLASTHFSSSFKPDFFKGDLFTPILDISFFSEFKPSWISPVFSYKAELYRNILSMELLGGGRYYFSKKPEYSKLIRSGLLAALNFKIRVYQQYFMDLGISLSPAKNMREDPVFGNDRFNYLPQMWIVFSWDTSWQSIVDFIDY